MSFRAKEISDFLDKILVWLSSCYMPQSENKWLGLVWYWSLSMHWCNKWITKVPTRTISGRTHYIFFVPVVESINSSTWRSHHQFILDLCYQDIFWFITHITTILIPSFEGNRKGNEDFKTCRLVGWSIELIPDPVVFGGEILIIN